MTAVFCHQKYDGEFVTLHYWNNEWGWQVTQWQFGKAKQHKMFDHIIPAILEIVQSGFIWANSKMRDVFEQDVILAGG